MIRLARALPSALLLHELDGDGLEDLAVATPSASRAPTSTVEGGYTGGGRVRGPA